MFWPCYAEDPRTGEPIDHPGTPRLFEPGSYNPIARRRAVLFSGWEGAVQRRRLRAAVDDVERRYPIFLTTGRVVSQFLSGTQTRRMARWWSSILSRGSRCIRGWPRSSASPTRLDDGGDGRGDDHAAREVVRPSARTRSSFRITGPGEKSANQLTVAAQDPISKIPEYKVCGAGEQGRRPAGLRRKLEPQQ